MCFTIHHGKRLDEMLKLSRELRGLSFVSDFKRLVSDKILNVSVLT